MSALAAFTGALLAFAPGPAQTAPLSSPVGHAAGGAVLVAGRVSDPSGNPVPGPVSVSIMPRDVQRGDTYPVVARGSANAAGNFEAVVTDPATIARIAGAQGGWIETITASDHAVSASAGVRSIHVTGRGSAQRLSVHAERNNDDVAVPAATKPLSLRVLPRPATAVRLGKKESRACGVTPLWQVIAEETKPAWTIVGELNNAYNDGTVGTFTYGQESHAETALGVAVDVNGAGFSISEESTITDSTTIGFPEFRRRLARKLRTMFMYKRTTETRTCPMTGVSDTRQTIRAVTWQSGTDIAVKQPGALDKCRPGAVGSFRPTSGFVRNSGTAVRWTSGATVFGVAITSQSGFSKNVTTEYRFGSRKKHYLCGPDGKQSPSTAGRIFSGRKRRA